MDLDNLDVADKQKQGVVDLSTLLHNLNEQGSGNSLPIEEIVHALNSARGQVNSLEDWITIENDNDTKEGYQLRLDRIVETMFQVLTDFPEIKGLYETALLGDKYLAESYEGWLEFYTEHFAE